MHSGEELASSRRGYGIEWGQARLDGAAVARGRRPGADGRDMGLCFSRRGPRFIAARSRADRRYKQLIEKGFSASITPLSLEQVRREIEARDQRDVQRAASPLKPADDAHCIDSSELSVDEVVSLVLNWYAQSQDVASRQ